MKNKIFVLVQLFLLVFFLCSCSGKNRQLENVQIAGDYLVVEQEHETTYGEENCVEEIKEHDSKETEFETIEIEDGGLTDDKESNSEEYSDAMYSLAHNDPRPEQRFVNTHLLEKMPEIKRPEGYDSPILSHETAIELLFEARRMAILIECSGCSYDYAEQWMKENMIIRTRVLCQYGDEYMFPICPFVPALDTFEEFDDFFCQVFTEATVDYAKQWNDIYAFDGKLVGLSGMNFPLAPYWNRIDSIRVEQEGGLAQVTVDVYRTNGTDDTSDDYHEGEKKFNFIYSEKYGWRIDMERLSELDYQSE